MGKFLYNKFLITNLLIGFIVLSSFFFFAYSSGITQKTKKNGQGCTCHGSSPNNSVNVVISGPQILSPGTKGTYQVSISGGPLMRAGTNIAASSGTLDVITGSGLQKIGDELTHTSPKTPQSGVVTFNFEFTAPNTPGTVTLYANGNSVNFDGSNSGDQWNFAANYPVTVSTTSVEQDISQIKYFELYQNYPNPFNPSTIISYNLIQDGFVSLKIYDLSGKEITTLIDEFQKKGLYEFEFDADKFKLSSGTYYYTIESNGLRDTRKFVYIR